MRCKNCGWENSGNMQKCEKCNAPLSGSMIESNTPAHHNSYAPIAENLKGTIPESGEEAAFVHEATDSTTPPTQCPNCRYPLRAAMTSCPNCSQPLGEKKKAAPAPLHRPAFKMGTVNSWESPQQGTFCTLKPLAWRGEEVTYQPISYSGTAISLNRANTDPNNNTITSKEQAILTCEGGNWYIENRSEQLTTFVRVQKRVKLESGDVIVLGNRLFEFKE